ncbi:MAG: membrane integrity-associated transporter subunit PqiC [Rubrivivax sp.]|nr:membrane integrity-associated transporter subunit PqiC [Rubrivivax sp.]
MNRLALVALLTAAALSACGSGSPPPRLYHLRSTAPASAPPAPAWAGAPWQLAAPLRLPEYLDRDAILAPEGQAGLRPLAGHRWAEPLAEGVPRVLRQDLAALLGEGAVWQGPLPAGQAAAGQLRLEITAFEATPDLRSVRLSARWSITTPARAPRSESRSVEVPVAGAEVDALVAAHRVALWRLAEALAQSLRGGA